MVLAGIARSPRHTLGNIASVATTSSIRHHTKGSAGRVIILPRIAVKPHSSTQKWICNWALAVGDRGMPLLSPMPARWRYETTETAMGESFTSYLRDLFSELGPVSLRKMFGGQGLYHDGVIIGLVIGDELFLKTDAITRSAFEQAGGVPFTYLGKGKPVVMSYLSPPAE